MNVVLQRTFLFLVARQREQFYEVLVMRDCPPPLFQCSISLSRPNSGRQGRFRVDGRQVPTKVLRLTQCLLVLTATQGFCCPSLRFFMFLRRPPTATYALTCFDYPLQLSLNRV